MFSSIGWSEMVILLVAALVVLGPERLPGAVRWTTRTLRQVRDYASGATTQLREELGPQFDAIRKPLDDLNELRKPLNGLHGLSPRHMVTKHLLDGDDSIFTGNFGIPADTDLPSRYSDTFSIAGPEKPLEHNEKPPIDTDAT